MLPFAWYLLKVIICSGILFGYYWFFLRNKIFHQYNRFYLLSAMVLSLLLPVLKINFWQPTSSPNTAISVLQAVSTGDEYMNDMLFVADNNSWSLEQFYTLAYMFVSLFFFFVLIRTLYRIMLLLKKYPVQQIEQVSFVNTEHASTPFSFFRYIFWNTNIDINTLTGRQIFKHEVAHIQEKHTYDKLFVNIALMFCWCNPFFWLYRKELNMIHEFIADKKAVEDSDTSAFAAMILQAAYPKHQFNLTNNFFYSPIKRRLMMLTKIDNPKLSYIARLMVLPLVVLVFAAFTLKARINDPIDHNKKNIVNTGAMYATDTIPTSQPMLDTVDYYKMYGKAETYKGQKIKSVFIRKSDNKAVVELVSGKKIILTQEQAFKAEIIAPPPPPPPGPQFDPTLPANKVSVESSILTSVKGVLFIGISNPILAVATGIKPEDLVLEISNGSLTGSNGNNYVARVTHPGKVMITLRKLEDPKIINSFELIAKRLPDITDPAFFEELKRKQGQQNISDDEVDTENALYVINGKVIGKGKAAYADIDKIIAEKLYVKWLKRTEAIAKYGKEGAGGACEITYTNGDIIKLSDDVKPVNDLNINQGPKLYLGATSGGSIQLDYLKSIKEISMSTGYKLVSATIYFEGPGFDKNVVQVKLNSNSLSPIATYINRCKDGTIIVFGEVKVADENGVVKTLIPYNPVFFVGPLNKPPSNTAAKKQEALDRQKEQQIEADKNNIIFTKAEVSPQFTGGEEAWKNYLRKNLNLLAPINEGWNAGKYLVAVKFIVHTDGTVSDITTENYKGTKIAQHCIDLIKQAPQWQPAVQNGRKVNAYKKQPITFVVE